MTVKSVTDDDLPWDPIWAYVLGDGDEETSKGAPPFRRKTKTTTEGDGIMSYIKDVLPASDSRDDKIPQQRSDIKDSKGESKKSGFVWRRNKKVDGSDADDVWEWQFSLGNSYDEVTPATSTRTDNVSPVRDGPPIKDRRSSLFRRIDSESTTPLKDGSDTAMRKQSGQRRSIESKSREDSWEWGLNTGSEQDDRVSSKIPPSKDPSQVKPHRSSTFASAFRKKNENESWDWPLLNAKKDKRRFSKRYSGSKEAENWDFLTASSQDKGPRRVRFARSSSSKDGSEWIDTKEVIAQLERSQTSLLDWVGINPSYEEDEVPQKFVRKNSDLSLDKSQTKGATSFSKSGDLFAGLFWEESSEDEDESSFQSSTDESSAGTFEEETGSDDDSKSQPTIVSDASQSFCRELNENDRSQLIRQDINEVRLSFQPLPFAETSTMQLPKIDEETSSTESLLANVQDSVIPDLHTDSIPRSHESSIIDKNIGSEPIGLGQSDQLRSTGRGMSCNVKRQSPEKKWSEVSDIPVHELSAEDQLRLFPKSRAVPDADQYSSPLVRSELQKSSNMSKHPIHPRENPLSLFQYEYDSERNMYVSYEKFGDDSLTVSRATIPDIISNEKNDGQTEMLVMVEASTVSATDCAIRQGLWWGTAKAPLPNTPGVDVVGRIYRVDIETNKKYGWKVGDRVISLVKWGGNARYLSLDPLHAIAAPETIDPAVATCLVETYLTAFQVLHIGQDSHKRYCDVSLSGKSILLRGLSISSMSHAIAQLAAIAHASNVYAVAKEKHFTYLSSLGITPLSNNGKDWLKAMTGKIDLIISCDDDMVTIPFKLLKGDGNVISLKNFASNSSNIGSKASIGLNFRRRLSRIPRNRTSSYNVYEQWDNDIDVCKRDIQHLLQLLEDKQIDPIILDRISLNKVDDAHNLLRSKRLRGHIVCEPWLVGKSRTICL